MIPMTMTMTMSKTKLLLSALLLALPALLSASTPLLAAAPAPRKAAVLPLPAGAGVDDKTASAVSDAFAGALARVPGVEVITQQQLKALLDLEAQKQLAGCTDDSCIAQIGSALGADDIVAGTLSHVGASWLVGARKVEVKSGASRLADRRLKNGSIDDVLDALPSLVAELYGTPPAPAASAATNTSTTNTNTNANTNANTTGPATTTPLAIRPSGPAPASTKDLPAVVDAAARKRLIAVSDGTTTIVYDPKPTDSWAPFFAGPASGKKLYAQRITGGGSDGEGNFDRVFWEPRVAERWQAELSKKDGKHFLQCGDKKIELREVKDKKAVERAELMDVRWQRRLVLAARSDELVYFVVDKARVPEDNTDFRLHVGRAGSFSFVRISDSVLEPDESIFVTDAGKLVVKLGDKPSGTFTPSGGGAPIALKVLDLEAAAGDAYGSKWKVFGEPLGTACDAYLP